jgi:class 3 adenylate cyclase
MRAVRREAERDRGAGRARVAAQASPGEILVSSTVKDLVAGSGIEFEDRGTHELKGVPGEWRLFAVRDA